MKHSYCNQLRRCLCTTQALRSSAGSFNYQADALTTWPILCTCTNAHIHNAKPFGCRCAVMPSQWLALGSLCATRVLWVITGLILMGYWLVTCRRLYHVSQVRIWAPKIPPGSSPTMQDMDSWHLLLREPIDVTAGWAASPVDTRPHSNNWVDWSNVSKVSCSTATPKWFHLELNLEPFDYMHTHTHYTYH